MNPTVQNWIDQIDLGGQVSLSGFAEIYAVYPTLDFTTALPTVIANLGSLTLYEITVEYDDADEIKSIVFSISTTNTIGMVAAYYQMANVEIHLGVVDPEGDEPFAVSSFVGQLSAQGSAAVVPVIIEEDPLSGGDLEKTWSVRFDRNIHLAQQMLFADVETFLNATVSDCMPVYLEELTNVVLLDLSLKVSFQLDTVKEGAYCIEYGTWILVEQPYVAIVDSELSMTAPLPYVETSVRVAFEGTLTVGSASLPRMKIEFPNDILDELALQMTEASYDLGNLSNLQELFGGYGVVAALPTNLSNFNNLLLDKLNVVVNTQFVGISSLSVSVSTPTDPQSEWPIIPSVFALKDIALDFDYAPPVIKLHGIITLGTTDIPMLVSYIIPEEGSVPSTLTFAYDTEAGIAGVPLPIGDLAGLGFAPTAIIPDLNVFNLTLADFLMEITFAEPAAVTQVRCVLASDTTWGLVNIITLDDVIFSCIYKKGETTAQDYYELEIDAIGTLNIVDVDPLPIKLTIPNTDNWCLTLGDKDSEGIALPNIASLTGLLNINIDSYVPDFLSFDGLLLQEMICVFPYSAENTLSSVYFSICIPQLLTIASLEFKDLKFQMNIDYTQTPTAYSGSLACTFELGEIHVPVYLPLALNSQEWTVKLTEAAYLPSLDYFSGFLGFDANDLLAELPGFGAIPAITLLRLDLKFDIDPYVMRKAAIQAEFTDGISVTLPPGLEIKIDDIAFDMSEQSGSFGVDTFTLNGSITKTIGEESVLPVQLKRSATTWEMTLKTEEGNPVSIKCGDISSLVPGINLPSQIEDFGVDITEIKLVLSNSMEIIEFSIYVTVNDANSTIPFDVFIESIPVKVLYEMKDGSAVYGIQLLKWPFKKPNMRYLQKEGWILLDFGAFGALTMSLPKLYTQEGNFVVSNQLEMTHAGEDVIMEDGSAFPGLELNIPIAMLFDQLGLSFLNSYFPESIPLVPKIDLRGIIQEAGGNPDKLPLAFQDYLTIEMPDLIEFNLVISAAGAVHVDFSIPSQSPDTTEPIKVLTPAPPFLVGTKIYKVGFSYICGFPVLHIDAETDVFMLPILVALGWFSVEKLPYLPKFEDIHMKLTSRDVWLLMSTCIPIPIFYDEIGFSYLGLEGLGAQSSIRFPKPGVGLQAFAAAGEMLTQLVRFLSEKDYYLTAQDFGSADMVFSMGPTNATLPEYVGGKFIGTHNDVFSVSATDLMVTMLNTLKNPRLDKLVEMIPQPIRLLNATISFGPIDCTATSGFISVDELRTQGVTGFTPEILDRLFGPIEESLVNLIAGTWHIGSLVNCEVLLGMSMRDLSGAGLHVHIAGAIGDDLLDLAITGVSMFDLENRANPFLFDLSAHLAMQDHTIGSLVVRFDVNGFYMKGDCSLIDWPVCKVNGTMEGSLDRGGNFLLRGDSVVSVAGVTLSNSSAEVTNSGIVVKNNWLGFNLDFYSTGSKAHFALVGSASISTISINQTLQSVSLPGPLGKYIDFDSLHIECDVSVSIGITLNREGFAGKVHIRFYFFKEFNKTITLPSLFDSYNALRDFIVNEVIEWIKDNILRDPEQGYEILKQWLKNGWAVASDIADSLKKAFGKGWKEICKFLDTVVKYSKKEICQALKRIGADAVDVARAIYQAFGLGVNHVAALLREVGFTAKQIARALKEVFRYSADQLVDNFVNNGFDLIETGQALLEEYGLTPGKIAGTLLGNGHDLPEIATTLANGLGLGHGPVAAALGFVGVDTNDICGILTGTLECSDSQMVVALCGIGVTPSGMMGALSNFYEGGAEQFVPLLVGVNISPSDIAQTCINYFGTQAGELATMLSGLGVSAYAMGYILKNTYKLLPSAAAEILYYDFGAGTDVVGETLCNYFILPTDNAVEMLTDIFSNSLELGPLVVADAMQHMGAAAVVIGNYLISEGVENVADVMEQVGISPTDVENFVEGLPNPIDEIHCEFNISCITKGCDHCFYVHPCDFCNFCVKKPCWKSFW